MQMNQELKDLLRSVLKEELQPIRKQLERVEQTQQELQRGQKVLEASVAQVQQDVAELQAGQQALQQDVAQLQAGQQKLEHEMSGMKQSLGNMERTGEKILEELRISKNNQALLLNDLTGIKKSMDVTVAYLQRRSDVMFDKMIEHEKEILNLKTRLPN
jgi:chromosome segregation ATPase